MSYEDLLEKYNKLMSMYEQTTNLCYELESKINNLNLEVDDLKNSNKLMEKKLKTLEGKNTSTISFLQEEKGWIEEIEIEESSDSSSYPRISSRQAIKNSLFASSEENTGIQENANNFFFWSTNHRISKKNYNLEKSDDLIRPEYPNLDFPFFNHSTINRISIGLTSGINLENMVEPKTPLEKLKRSKDLLLLYLNKNESKNQIYEKCCILYELISVNKKKKLKYPYYFKKQIFSIQFKNEYPKKNTF